MKKALAKYQEMNKTRRLLAQVPNKSKDALTWEQDQFTRPQDVLDLRVVQRHYPYAEMTSFDVRHPMYYALDRMWLKPSEYRAFIPTPLSVGSKAAVTGPACERVVRLNHLTKACTGWYDDQIKEASMESKIVAIKGDQVHLRLTAGYRAQGNTKYNRDTYNGRLLGKAIWNNRSHRFEQFEMVSLGTHKVGIRQDNLHAGSSTSQAASLFTLNPLKNPDDRMIPAQWKWGYGLKWCKG